MPDSVDRSTCTAQRHGTRSAYQKAGCTCPDAVEKFRRYGRYQWAGRLHLCPDVDRRVDATGTRRRIQALYALGHLERDLAPQLGAQNGRIAFMHNTKGKHGRLHVYQSTADAVTRLYNRLSMTPGPSRQQRSRARRFGWSPPLAWEDVDIDDPNAEPIHTNTDDDGEVDEIAVLRAFSGRAHYDDLRDVDRKEAIDRMAQKRMKSADIASRLHTSVDKIKRVRATRHQRRYRQRRHEQEAC